MECCSSLLDIATFRIVTLWSYCNETYMGKTRWAVAAASTGGVAVDRDACYFDRGRRLGPPTPRTVSVRCSLWPRRRSKSSCRILCPAHSLQQNVRTTSQFLREMRYKKLRNVWGLRFCNGAGTFMSSATLRLVDRWIFTDVSEKRAACSGTVLPCKWRQYGLSKCR